MSGFFHGPAFAIVITLLLYVASLRLQRRYPWANPLMTATVALILLLYMMHISYAQYRVGGNAFAYLLGPATVALGVPMYKQGKKLKGSLGRLLAVVVVGSIVGMVSAGLVAWMCGASHQVVLSTLPKSVTTPIAIQLSTEMHGDPAITAAMGTSSHALGTATLIQRSEVQGSVSSMAMAMAGVVTSIFAMLVTRYWQ